MNSSAWEKLQGATLSLARSGALKDRLTDAYRNHLALIDETELPKELRETFRHFSTRLTRERPLVRGDDAFRATLRKMSNGEAEEVATSVVRLFCGGSAARDGRLAPGVWQLTCGGAALYR